MRLIGMLDSPYVRRVAISLDRLGLPFEHESLSVFRHFEAFAAINPVVKAPSLVTDEGVVLMDSTLILEHAERLAGPDASLAPASLTDHARAQRILGLALVACEKTVQLVYEHQLRPEERRHLPWVERVSGQLHAAYAALEAEVAAHAGGEGWLFGARPLQADITAAVTLSFTRHMRPDALAGTPLPALAALTEQAEALDAFRRWPIG
ncbi:glutathione S-transferase family protein [Ancylobacter sp. 6x-1]|uniref:Glutathione S-transferase family protein n=1 Tax=Ancylobacter crimeensis TaxID=2579147 RepID=A0ABT0D6A8_9HYPH|nr:glutathione S-transferase family protein [Ancylobacter crimeensis]MCK0195478.1 glutathione S-transferase family protein [Ancylobacter crimeensis]